MDREQEEMQFLGFFGIFNLSCTVIFSWKKIFTQLTLALILPLAFIFLLYMEVSDLLFDNIINKEIALEETQTGTPGYHILSDIASKEWTRFLLFQAAYFTFLLIFSLLSTSAVVYTLASIYTAREVSFCEVMSVVPKVWKRLMVTFLCIFVAMLLYNIIAVLVFMFLETMIGHTHIVIVGFIVVSLLYMVGFVFMSIVWQLASVVSVLEEACGIQAMTKSRELIKGKMGLAVVVFIILNVLLWAIQIAFQNFVVQGNSLGFFFRIGFGLLLLSLLCMFMLFGLTIQTIIYFVCKSNHHEYINKTALSDHLEVYLGDYSPLKSSKDVQLQQCA